MKTKLLFYANQKLKNGIKHNAIFTFLIILLMTVTSFGQTTFTLEAECGSFGTLYFQFEDPDQNNVVIGEVLVSLDPENVLQGGWQLLAVPADPGSATNNFDRWEIQAPGSPGEGVRWFYTEKIPEGSLPEDPCSAIWVIDNVGQCLNVIEVTCTGGPPDEEVCDGIDNDGDGQIDEDLDFITYYADSDGDGFGDPDNTTSTCDGAPAGFVEDNTDCDDLEYEVYPGAPEICDGLDNNCDGQIDEGITDCIDGVIIEYCDDKQKKVLICHNGKTKCVSINAMDAHLAHGDYLGTCGGSSREEEVLAEERPTSYDLDSWPNPTNDLFNVKIVTPNYEDKVNLQAFDINGRLIHANIINGNEDYQFGTNLESGVYFVKVTQANTTEVIKVIKR